MKKTAATAASAPCSVRIVWVTSLLQAGPPVGGMLFDDKGAPQVLPKSMENYMQSKVGQAWLANEFASRLDKYKIMSVVS